MLILALAMAAWITLARVSSRLLGCFAAVITPVSKR